MVGFGDLDRRGRRIADGGTALGGHRTRAAVADRSSREPPFFFLGREVVEADCGRGADTIDGLEAWQPLYESAQADF